MVSYKSKPSKCVLMLSTLHSDGKIDESGDFAKPQIITFYNFTKVGVDIVDWMKAMYSVGRVSCQWPLTIFLGLLNIGRINSQIIFKSNTNNDLPCQVYLKTLAVDLMKHLINHSKIPNIPFHDQKIMKCIAGVDKDGIPLEIQQGFCAFCTHMKYRKSKKQCGKCNRSICSEHIIYTCPDCSYWIPINIFSKVQSHSHKNVDFLYISICFNFHVNFEN